MVCTTTAEEEEEGKMVEATKPSELNYIKKRRLVNLSSR